MANGKPVRRERTHPIYKKMFGAVCALVGTVGLICFVAMLIGMGSHMPRVSGSLFCLAVGIGGVYLAYRILDEAFAESKAMNAMTDAAFDVPIQPLPCGQPSEIGVRIVPAGPTRIDSVDLMVISYVPASSSYGFWTSPSDAGDTRRRDYYLEELELGEDEEFLERIESGSTAETRQTIVIPTDSAYHFPEKAEPTKWEFRLVVDIADAATFRHARDIRVQRPS